MLLSKGFVATYGRLLEETARHAGSFAEFAASVGILYNQEQQRAP